MITHLEGKAAHLQRAWMKDATSVRNWKSGKGLKSAKVQKCKSATGSSSLSSGLTNLDSFASQATREEINFQIRFNAV